MMLGLSCLPWRRAVLVNPNGSVQDFTYPMDGWLADPITGCEERVYRFTLDAGFVADSMGHIGEQQIRDFTTWSGFAADGFGYADRVYPFTTNNGFVSDDVDTSAPNDTPTVPDTDAGPFMPEIGIDVSGITTGTSAQAGSASSLRLGAGGSALIYAYCPDAGLTSPVGGYAEWESGLPALFTKLDYNVSKTVNPTYAAAGYGCATFQNYYAYSAHFARWPMQNARTDAGATISAPRSISVWGKGLEKGIAGLPWKNGDIQGLPALTAGGWVTLTDSTVDLYLKDHSAPLSFGVHSGAEAAANSAYAALVADGYEFSVMAANDSLAADSLFLDPDSLHANRRGGVAFAYFPKLTGGTFRFSSQDVDEFGVPSGAITYSSTLNLLTCTKAQIQAALDAMPSVAAAGGLTVLSIARPYSAPGARVFETGTNELFIRL
jgi:hypothetical protein